MYIIPRIWVEGHGRAVAGWGTGGTEGSRCLARGSIGPGSHPASWSTVHVTAVTCGKRLTEACTAWMMLPACQQPGLVSTGVTATRPPSTAMSLTMPISASVKGTPVAMEHGSTTRASASRTSASVTGRGSALPDMAGGVGSRERGGRPAVAAAEREFIVLDRG